MRRLVIALQLKPGKKEEFRKLCADLQKSLPAELTSAGIGNFSIWSAGGLALCYGEAAAETPGADEAALLRLLLKDAEDCCDILGSPPGAPPRLMYEDIGIVRQGKSKIRHRVFITKLKPGCEEEYKRRHDELIASRSGRVNPGPESNFTIWYAGGYIFGYCELDRSMEHPQTDEEHAATVAWETRMLEIMDWVTDDVDWLTGVRHDKIELMLRQ